MRLLRVPQTADNTAMAGAQLAHDIIMAGPAEQQEPQTQQHPYHNISAMHIVDVQQLKMAKSMAANNKTSSTTTMSNSSRRRKQNKTKHAQHLQNAAATGEDNNYNYNTSEQHDRNNTIGLFAKSRSLERYAKPPHATLLALEHDATLTPNLNVSPRRRFLSPFKSLKRRSRSSSSSGGGSSRCDSRDVAVAAMLALQREPTQEARVEQFTTAQTTLQQHVAKRAQHLHSASSQSGDSGTGGTELEMELQDCSRASAAASSQLSLSFSQLSSGADGDGEVDDDSSSDTPAVGVDVERAVSTPLQSPSGSKRGACGGEGTNVVETNVKCADVATSHMLAEKQVVSADVDDDESHNFVVTVDDLDASFVEESPYTIGNITIVDDTYSNYDPKNDAERMFLQVVGILRDENEVRYVMYICIFNLIPKKSEHINKNLYLLLFPFFLSNIFQLLLFN